MIEVSGGTLRIDGPVTGTGSFLIDPDGTLLLEGANAEPVAFGSPGGTLETRVRRRPPRRPCPTWPRATPWTC